MRAISVAIVLTIAVAPAYTSQAGLGLETVMERASEFAVRQRDALADVRADEQYRQEQRTTDGMLMRSRRLESEIAFVQLTGRSEWLAFRNVIRVDDKPTGTDTARLEKLFREGAAEGQWRRITEENAIYNLGRLQRTWNVPTLPMHLVMPQHLSRFKFKKVSGDGPNGTWVVSYEERGSPTLVRTPEFKPVRLRGRLWIAPGDGHLERATVEADVPVRTDLEFTCRFDDKLAAWVPSEMRERYRGLGPDFRDHRRYDVVGVATYTNYRRFAVDVRIK